MKRLLVSFLLTFASSAAGAGPRPSGFLDTIEPCGWMSCPGGQCTLEFFDPDHLGPANYWIQVASDYGSKDFDAPYLSVDYIYRDIGIDGKFTYTYNETHLPGTKHCVRVSRMSPTGTGWSGGKRCWLTGSPRAPDACDYRLEVAHDPAMLDVVRSRTSTRATSTGLTLWPELGRRVYWRFCARNPVAESCTNSRVLWIDTGLDSTCAETGQPRRRPLRGATSCRTSLSRRSSPR
jgi:hypothetical protein